MNCQKAGNLVGCAQGGRHEPRRSTIRFLRWSRMGVFNNIFTELAKTAGQDGQVMIDATHLKAHRTAASLLKKGLFPAASDAQRAG